MGSGQNWVGPKDWRLSWVGPRNRCVSWVGPKDQCVSWVGPRDQRGEQDFGWVGPSDASQLFRAESFVVALLGFVDFAGVRDGPVVQPAERLAQ